MKKRKGTLLMTIGLLFLTVALGLTGYNIYESMKAQSTAERVAAELGEMISGLKETNTEGELDYMKFPEKEMPTVEVDGERYIGILEIPDIALSLPVMGGEWSYAKLKTAPCLYSGSAYKDNMVIAAHNYRSHFGRIKNLNIGSEVYFIDMDGNIFQYILGSTEIVQPTDVEGMTEGDWDMTLFTCTYSGQQRYALRYIRQE